MTSRSLLLLTAACSLLFARPVAAAVAPEITNDAFEQIAEEAFIYGFPMVTGYGVMHDYAIDRESGQYKAPFNDLYNTARVYTPQDTAVVTPNSDTPYSFVWADLRAEPLVITVPEIEAHRYYSIQFVDLYTFNYGYVGSRETGNGAGTYLIAGPSWKGQVPDGIDRLYRCETDFSFVIIRTQLFGPQDLANVREIQKGYSVRPLSEHLGNKPPRRNAIAWPTFDKEQAATNPFAYLAFLLQFCPTSGPAAVEKSFRQRMAQIGIRAGETFDVAALTPEQKNRLATAIRNGTEKIRKRVAAIGTEQNGWRLGSAAGDRTFYDGDWLLRAAGAMAGIYGNSRDEAFYPFLVTDAAGNAPDGSTGRYTLTFQPGQLPPVNAFWSITMYDARTQMLVENPIDRYLINSPMLSGLKKQDDGSLTLYLQKDSPGSVRESNWLPAPDGPMFVVMRLYWPRPAALDGTWTPPALEPVRPDTAMRQHRRLDYGERSVENVVRTDERYGSNGLFQGPRGWIYWTKLQAPRPIQNPNLWPDTQSTYFLSRFEIPRGARLTFRFRFPHARYFQFALYKAERNTFVSIGEALSGPDIIPDDGSVNPFHIGADRRAENRNCTLRVVATDPPSSPADRKPNTMYVGRDGGLLQGVIRIYLPDRGWDGTGWGPASSPATVPAFDFSGRLADGSELTSPEVVRQLARPVAGATNPPISVDEWVELVHSPKNDPSLDPETAPARPVPEWEKYWGIPYSIVGAFRSPAERAAIPHGGAIDGGGDPTTQYFLTHLSRKFGPVYVMEGKMPTFPDTYAGPDGTGLTTMPHAQTQYWSLVSCEAAPSGQIVDGLADMQVPLDENRNYTIVCSRREDRPKNATVENGIAWIEWSPRGEGLNDPRNRRDFGMLMLRIMATDPAWSQRPDNVTEPGMEESVMGPYLPRGRYTDRATFESEGPK